MEILIIVVVLGIIGVWLIVGYNNFVRLIEAVKNSEKKIHLELDRRGKVFDSLLSAVNKYLDHESGIFKEVARLRSQAMNGGRALDDSKVKEAEDKLSEIVSSGQINIAVENYPELKSQENMLQLQEEIVNTENKLNFAKSAFNNAIETYNIAQRSFPGNIIPKIFSGVNESFEYWSLTEEKVQQEEDRRIEF